MALTDIREPKTTHFIVDAEGDIHLISEAAQRIAAKMTVIEPLALLVKIMEEINDA